MKNEIFVTINFDGKVISKIPVSSYNGGIRYTGYGKAVGKIMKQWISSEFNNAIVTYKASVTSVDLNIECSEDESEYQAIKNLAEKLKTKFKEANLHYNTKKPSDNVFTTEDGKRAEIDCQFIFIRVNKNPNVAKSTKSAPRSGGRSFPRKPQGDAGSDKSKYSRDGFEPFCNGWLIQKKEIPSKNTVLYAIKPKKGIKAVGKDEWSAFKSQVYIDTGIKWSPSNYQFEKWGEWAGDQKNELCAIIGKYYSDESDEPQPKTTPAPEPQSQPEPQSKIAWDIELNPREEAIVIYNKLGWIDFSEVVDAKSYESHEFLVDSDYRFKNGPKVPAGTNMPTWYLMSGDIKSLYYRCIFFVKGDTLKIKYKGQYDGAEVEFDGLYYVAELNYIEGAFDVLLSPDNDKNLKFKSAMKLQNFILSADEFYVYDIRGNYGMEWWYSYEGKTDLEKYTNAVETQLYTNPNFKPFFDKANEFVNRILRTDKSDERIDWLTEYIRRYGRKNWFQMVYCVAQRVSEREYSIPASLHPYMYDFYEEIQKYIEDKKPDSEILYEICNGPSVLIKGDGNIAPDWSSTPTSPVTIKDAEGFSAFGDLLPKQFESRRAAMNFIKNEYSRLNNLGYSKFRFEDGDRVDFSITEANPNLCPDYFLDEKADAMIYNALFDENNACKVVVMEGPEDKNEFEANAEEIRNVLTEKINLVRYFDKRYKALKKISVEEAIKVVAASYPYTLSMLLNEPQPEPSEQRQQQVPPTTPEPSTPDQTQMPDNEQQDTVDAEIQKKISALEMLLSLQDNKSDREAIQKKIMALKILTND